MKTYRYCASFGHRVATMDIEFSLTGTKRGDPPTREQQECGALAFLESLVSDPSAWSLSALEEEG